MKKGFIQFIGGIILAFGSCFLVYAKDFLGGRIVVIAMIIGAIGIVLILTSKYSPLKRNGNNNKRAYLF